MPTVRRSEGEVGEVGHRPDHAKRELHGKHGVRARIAFLYFDKSPHA
jgi:hypothetical protein